MSFLQKETNKICGKPTEVNRLRVEFEHQESVCSLVDPRRSFPTGVPLKTSLLDTYGGQVVTLRDKRPQPHTPSLEGSLLSRLRLNRTLLHLNNNRRWEPPVPYDKQVIKFK